MKKVSVNQLKCKYECHTHTPALYTVVDFDHFL